MSEKTAADRLDDYLHGWLSEQLRGCEGYEREALIELVRSADLHAYFLHFFRAPKLTSQFANQCRLIQIGIGTMLKAFLPKVGGLGDGLPWAPSSKKNSVWADGALIRAGQLTVLRRLSHGERYGLVRCERRSDEHICIHVVGSNVEALDRDDHAWLVSNALNSMEEQQALVSQQIMGWARDRIDEFVYIDRDHFIGYDSDYELLKLYQERARILMVTSAEADSLPDEVMIGPRTFGAWKELVVEAAARASLHLSFATRLSALNEDRLDLRNLFTVPVRYDDLKAVWRQQTGIEDDHGLGEIADILMLTPVHAEEYFSHYDSPLPYAIWFGDYFALLPQFGYLGNLTTFLVTELRRKYRRDWDRAVNEREAKFIQEVFDLLPEPRYVRGRENVVIRSSAGNVETDIDAVLFDRTRNCLYLLQIKWFDVFAYGLRERQSKLSNLLKANKWVEQIHRWATDTPREKLLLNVGLPDVVSAPQAMAIRPIVLTRNVARFSGSHRYDERAAWISWPRLCRLVKENAGKDSPLEIAWQIAKSDEYVSPRASTECTEYRFPGLKVDVFG